jgi:co-chaperonin GroES (HSP10)
MSNAALKMRDGAHLDTKEEIIKKIGDLSDFEIAQEEVLVAIYMRPEKTAGGIILTPKNLQEDRYQGKVGLVLKIGASCKFERTDAKTGRTFGIPIKLHDWVLMRPSDTWAFDLNSNPNLQELKDFVPCRLVYEDVIRARVPHPGVIY